MRNICCLFLFFFLCLSLSANLVENKPFEHTQPDGKKLSLYVTGDEYYHRVHDAAGYTILQHPKTGYAVYAIPDGNTIKASEYNVTEIDPVSLGIEPNLFADTQDAELRAEMNQRGRDAGNRATPTGTLSNIVAFIRFNDQTEFPFTKPYSTFDNLYNSLTSASLKDFYAEVSNGQLTIDSYLYPAPDVNGYVVSLQASHNRNYYSPFNEATNPAGYATDIERNQRYNALIVEIVGMLDPLVSDDLDLDSDNDGIVDALTFIIRGETDDWADLLWPMHAYLGGTVTTLNNTNVTHLVQDFENGLGTSVICHEMGHMIGAPDLYHYSNGNHMGSREPWRSISPVSSWCLMASDRTQHWLTYMKWKYGTWFPTIPTITPTSTPTEYTLTAIDQSPYSCYKIASSDPNQFYMLEYRRQNGRYETGVPGSGLIIYRIIDQINGNAVNGNHNGPPDEVYVYRPGGDIDSNGSPASAFYSVQSGRTIIDNGTNPKPWLYADTLSTPDGNLIIYDVGSSGGGIISFTVSTVPRNTWTGAENQSWINPDNWTMRVPTSDQDVLIPGGIENFPIIDTEAHCKNIVVKENGDLWISSDTLHVTGDFRCSGHLRMDGYSGKGLRVDGDIYWESGADTYTVDGYYINVHGNMTYEEGSDASMYGGIITFNGQEDSYIHVKNGFTTVPTLINNKTYPAKLEYSSSSTGDLMISGEFYNNSGCLFRMTNSRTLLINGSLYNYSDGQIRFESGTVDFCGSGSNTIHDQEADSYFHNLTISADNNGYQINLTLFNTLNVNGNFTLNSGPLQANDNYINVKGNWNDVSFLNTGTEGFIRGTSTVVFNGTGHQTISGKTHFNKLDFNKPSGEMFFPDSTEIECDIYDWVAGAYTIDGGSFKVNDLADDGIFGTIVLASGSIEYHQDINEYVDLRGNLTIYDGNFSIYGGSDTALFSYIDAAELTLSGGILDYKNVGIKMLGVYDFSSSITGGHIRTAGEFICERTNFHPTGGIIELYGSSDVNLQCANGSNFYNLEINKFSRGDTIQPLYRQISRTRETNSGRNLTRSCAVTGIDTLDIDGYFILTGGTFTAPPLMRIAGDWINSAGPAAFVEGTGTVEFNGSGDQFNSFSENFNTLHIDKPTGYYVLNDTTTVVTCNSYTWSSGKIKVTAGIFTANDLSQNGIYGKFYCYDDGIINLHQDASQLIDLNGYLYLYGGYINLYGGSMDCSPSFGADAGITMSDGVLDFKDKGLFFETTTHSLTTTLTGGTIRVTGGWYDDRGDVVLSGGTVVMYGTADKLIRQATGSCFNNLAIEKAVSGSIRVYALSDLVINGTLWVLTGVFDVNGQDIQIGSHTWINSTLKMQNSGTITTTGNFSWFSGSTSQINSGSITCNGLWSFNDGSTAQLSGCNVILTNTAGIDITYASPNSWFGRLTLDGNGVGIGSIFEFNLANTDSLIITGTLTINSNNHLNLNAIPMRVNNILIQDTGSINTGSFGYLKITSDLDLHGKLDMTSATVIVDGTYISYNTSILQADYGLLKVYNSASRTERTLVNLGGAIHLNSGTIYVLNNGIYIATHADRIWTNCTIMVDGNFTANETNAFLQDSGEVRCIGALNSLIDVSNGNYVCNLSVYKGTTNSAGLANNITVKGNVYIYSGILAGSTYNMIVNGNWSNVSGADKFVPGTGTVTFNKIGSTQTINGATNFYNVTESHSGTTLDALSAITVSNILNVNYGINFQAAATIGTMNNTGASAEVKFNNSYTSTITNYNGGGKLRAYTLSNVVVSDLVNNGIFGTYYVDNAVIELRQGSNQGIDLNGPVTILNNGRIDVYGGSGDSYFTYNGSVNLTMNSGEFNFKNRGIRLFFGLNSFVCNITGGIIRCNGGFQSTREEFTPSGGRVELTGSTDCNIKMDYGYFNDLYINKSSGRDEEDSSEDIINPDGTVTHPTRANTASLTANVTVKGNLCIVAGVLSALTRSIYVYKNWINQVGPSAFNEGTGTVTLYGTSNDSGITTSETFYNLSLSNSSANWDNVEISNNATVNVTNNLAIYDGTLNMKDNTTLLVGNDVSISSGAGINAYNGANASITVGRNWTDANTVISDAAGYKYGTSTLTFNGASTSVVSVGTTSLEAYNFTINKTSGVQTQFSKPVKVYGNFNLNSGIWYDSVTNLIHEFRGNCAIGLSGVWHTSNRNTIALKGSADQTLCNLGASSIYNLTVDKPGSRDGRVNSVSLSTNFTGSNGGTLLINAGILDLNQFYYRTSGDVTINNTGKIVVDADGSFELTDAKTLNVNTGGIIELIGYNLHPAKLTHQTGYYGVNINSGATISAKYALFEYMNSSGVYVKSGAYVTDSLAFKNCTFQNGASGGTLLWIDNSQTLSIMSPIFPSDTWSGTYNIKKTLDQGTINIYDDFGAFTGSPFESDTYNRINWIGLTPVETPLISYIRVTNSIRLDWTYPYTVTRFRIYSSTNPDGPFTHLAGTSTTTFYSEPASETKNFYVIIAEFAAR